MEGLSCLNFSKEDGVDRSLGSQPSRSPPCPLDPAGVPWEGRARTSGAGCWLRGAPLHGDGALLPFGLCWEGSPVCVIQREGMRPSGERSWCACALADLGLWPGRRGPSPPPLQAAAGQRAAPAEVGVRELGPGAVRWGCRPAAPFMSRAPLLEEKINHCPLWGEEGATNKVAFGWAWKLLPQAPSSLCGNQWAFNPRPVPWGNVGFSQQWPQPPVWGSGTADRAGGCREWSCRPGAFAAGRYPAGGWPSLPSR